MFINDLTIPFRGLIQYTDRYKQAQELYNTNKDKIQTIVSHSLGSVIGYHLILENEQLNGRLYSSPSLAIPHARIEYFSHYGDPIAMFNLDRRNRRLYLGNPHTYTGY
jgi:predicted alpha/beta superfamily hydrolase